MIGENDIQGLVENDLRVKEKASELREWITFDAAIELLAVHMVASDIDAAAMDKMSKLSDNLACMAQAEVSKHLETIGFARVAVKLARISTARVLKIRTDLSNKGKAAANARHDKPGESREKREAIRAAWASGKYSSRDVCSEQECAALNIAPGTARKALRNTPEPPRRCTA